MRISALSLILLALLALQACTNEQIYNTVQQNEQLECGKLPQVQYEECMSDLGMPYQQYERERQEVITGKPQ